MSASPRSAHWRLVLTPAASGAENMALDEALMERARDTGEWMLRVYSWRTPTISLGRNQTARGLYDVDRIRERGMDVVRRPTGGRAILHAREITYSVTAPVAAAGDLRQSYERINGLLAAALASMGVDATPAPARRAANPGMSPCFDHPSAGELTVRGRKLAGSAQWRGDGALLQHGSILVEDDQTSLADFAIGGGSSIPGPATLAAILGRTPAPRELMVAFGQAIREHEDDGASEIALEEHVRARATALVVRYVDDAWTWRR